MKLGVDGGRKRHMERLPLHRVLHPLGGLAEQSSPGEGVERAVREDQQPFTGLDQVRHRRDQGGKNLGERFQVGHAGGSRPACASVESSPTFTTTTPCSGASCARGVGLAHHEQGEESAQRVPRKFLEMLHLLVLRAI